jgi:2-desacetyl-2-hydroxyethyl bacteriochlorophyllide A dehydrogenase
MRSSLNIVFTGPSQLELREEPVPELKPTQVLVRSRKTLISMGTELICFERRFGPDTHWERWVTYPFYPGYSNAGIVEAVGAEVTGLRPGDRVAARAQHRQWAPVDAARVVPIPDGISDEAATWFGLACIVQNGVRQAEHALGDAVAVVGLGPLGQLVTQYARLLGAREVIAIDPVSSRLELAAARGATQVLPLRADAALQPVRDLTGGRGVDVAYDVTGHAAVFSSVLGLPRKLGKVVLLGDTGTPSEQRLTGDVIRNGLRIIGAHDINPPQVATDHAWWTHFNMTGLFFTYLLRRQMEVEGLVSHRYSPLQAAECYGTIAADRGGMMGVIFDWTDI